MTEGGDFGGWLKQQCQSQGLSLRQAATKTGLSHATIREIINGGSPSPESIKKLAQAFGSDGRGGLALEDKLLVLAGYRRPRPEGEELREPLARLVDKLGRFNDAQLKIVGRFADFLGEMGSK